MAKCKEKDPATNQDAEAVSRHRHWCEVLDRGTDRKDANAVEKGLTPGAAGTTPWVTPSRGDTIELEDWTLAASLDEHEEMARLIEQTTMDDGGASFGRCIQTRICDAGWVLRTRSEGNWRCVAKSFRSCAM